MYKFLLTAALILVAGCSSSDVSFSIDNPTNAALKLQIDQQTYDIGPRQSQTITLKAGEHHMDAPATGKVRFIVYSERKGGLINPTLSDYVIVSEAYVTDDVKLKNFRPSGGGPFQLDGVSFSGPFTLENGLFIENSWRFGVAEPFPASVSGHDPGNGGNIYSKIFTAADFVSYFEKQSGQDGYFEKHRQPVSPTPRTLPRQAPLPDFANPEMQNATLKLRQLYQRYQTAADPTVQKQLQKDYFKLTMDLTSFAAPRLSAQPVEENVKYNDFVRLTGNAMGWSARVVAQ